MSEGEFGFGKLYRNRLSEEGLRQVRVGVAKSGLRGKAAYKYAKSERLLMQQVERLTGPLEPKPPKKPR